MDNPLLTPSDLPPFDRIGAQDVAPAIDVLLERASQALETVTAPGFPARWQAIMEQLEVPNEQLLRAWGAISHLNSVADTPPPPRAWGPHHPFNRGAPPPATAGRLQRRPAAHHRILDPPGHQRAAVRQVQGHRPRVTDARAK